MFPARRYPGTYTSSSYTSVRTAQTLRPGSSQVANIGSDPKWVWIFNSMVFGSGHRERGKDEDVCVLRHTKSKLYMESISAERVSCKQQPPASHRFFLISEKMYLDLIKDYRTYWILYLAKRNGASLIFQDHKLHLWWADVSFAEKCTTQSIFKISKPLVGWCQGSPKFLLPVVLVWGRTEHLNWKIEIYYFDHLKLPDKADKEAVFIATS